MGTCFAGLCHDCKESIDLDKFYSFCAISCLADLEGEDLADYDESFVYRSLRLHLFMESHKGHRLGVYRDSDPEYEEASETYKDTFPWPSNGKAPTDYIDLRDCKTPLVVLETRHGTLYIDHLPQGVNCFRFDADGHRVDTLLLATDPPREVVNIQSATRTTKTIGAALSQTQQRFTPDNPFY